MSSIGSLAALVTANAEPFMSKMGDVRSIASSTARSIVSSFTSASGIGGLLTAGGLLEGAREGVNHILALKKAGDAWGISMERMRGFEMAAGGDLEDVSAGMSRFVKTLGEARLGLGDSAKGFELLGLDAKQLSQQQTDVAIAKVGDELKKVENPFERAAVKAQIFGKNFAAMTPLLDKGAAGLQHAQEAANRFGNLTAEDAAKARAAAAQLKEMKALKDEALDALGVTFAETSILLETGYKYVTQGRGAAKAYVDELKSKMKAAKQEALIDPRAKIEEKEAADRAVQFGNAIVDLNDKLDEERAALDGTASAVDKLAKKYGSLATTAALAVPRQKEEDLKAAKEQKKLMEEGEKLTEQSRGTLDGFNAHMDHLKKLVDAGAISWAVYASQAHKAVEELARATELGEMQTSAPALAAGSNAAFQAIAAAQSTSAQSAQERLQQILEQAREYQRRIEKNTADTAEALKSVRVVQI